MYNHHHMIEGQFKNNIEKQTKWNEAVSIAEKITDKLGKKIDSGIKETVVAFLVNGFDTIGSCEGHVDHGYPYAWIDVSRNPQLNGFKEEESALLGEIKNKGYETFFDIPETDKELHQRFTILRDVAVAYSREVESKMAALIENFYSSHKPISEDFTLIFSENGRIEPKSGAGIGKDNWAKFGLKIKQMTPEEKINYLKNSQNEMSTFTHFLKDKFMKS